MEELIRNNEKLSNILMRRIMFATMIIWGVLMMELYITNQNPHGPVVYMMICLMGEAVLGIGVVTDFLLPERYSEWRKYISIGCFLIMLIIMNVLYCRSIQLSFFLPMMLSCRFYDEKFQRQVSYLTLITIVLAWLSSGLIGYSLDVNYVRYMPGLIIKLTKASWLEDVLDGEFYDRIYVTINYIKYAVPPNVLFWLLAHIGLNGITNSSRMLMKQEAVSAANEAAYAQELHIGRRIQQSMLPKDFQNFAGHEKLDIFGYYKSAAEVGGDFYTFFAIDDHRQCFMVGDVSGKGIPAAFFMTRCLTCLKNYAMMQLDTGEIISRANRFMCEGNKDEMFVTVWIGILDTEKQMLQFTSGGHNPSLICRKGGSFEFLKRKSNFILALEPSVQYYSDAIPFHQGDRIFLYTDGVTECMNSEEQCYGNEKLKEFLNKHKVGSGKATVQALAEDLNKHKGSAPQSDDITMLMVEML